VLHAALSVTVVASIVGQAAPPPAAQPPAATAPRTLAIDLLFEMESVAAPRLSPDGKQLLFTRSWNDAVNDRPVNELWLLDVGGGERRPRQLGEGSGAEWSPDGSRIAFLREGKPRGAQVHVMWVATREVTQITRGDEEPSALRWSPDGRRIAFQSGVPEKQDALPITLPKRPEGAKWAEDATIISRLDYRRDRSGWRPAGWKHLFVVDADGGTARQVTNGDFDHGPGEWSGDGARLVFSGLREADADWRVFEREIYDVDVASGAVRDLSKLAGEEDGPRVSPDGKWIAFVATPDASTSRHTYDPNTVMVMAADGGAARALTAALDRDAFDLTWSRDSKTLLFTVESGGERQAWSCPLDGTPRRLTSGSQRLTLGDVGPGGELYAVTTSPQRPPDLVRVAPAAGDRARADFLTAVNDDVLSGLALGAVEERKWKSADGLEVQGWLVTPPDFDARRAKGEKLPLALQIHGGPHSMYGVDWSFERQWLAAKGYAVLYTNPRGSTGYGQAFGNAIQNAYPGKDYDDLMAGVDAVLAEGFVDPAKLCVYGGSGGGVLTAWIVGHTDRFAAAVSMFPVIDWVSFVGTTDGPSWYWNFAKLPWEDMTEHWDRSPLKYVGHVTTPTMLITGELDLRTPMAQTEEYYQALKFRKVDTLMVRIPDEYHGAAGRHVSNTARRMLYVDAWFAKHLAKEPKKELPAAATGAATSGS